MSNENKNLYKFGGFRLDTQTNTLWRDGELISLSPKALELLKLLIKKQGEVVSKQEIFDTVWADTFVEEGVLTQNIYTLRQALGTDENGKQLIENLARRGYRLTVAIHQEGAKSDEELPKQEVAVNIQKSQILNFPPKLIAVAAGIILILLVSFLSYRFVVSKNPELPNAELKFRQLTDTGDASYLTISPDGNLVAYALGSNIFLRYLQNNIETKLNLENAKKIGCLQFSPDNNFIYFGTINNRDEIGQILRVSQAGGLPEAIADNVWSGFSVSPNGQELAFVRKFPDKNKQGLIIKNLQTGIEKTLETLDLPEEFYWNNYPAWSPDGKKIALVAVTQSEHFSRLLLIDKDSGSETEFRPPNFRNIEQTVWSGDGNSLVAAANDGNNFQLWKISLADNSAKRITNDLNSYLGISISHDGKKLLSRQRIYYSNIWIGKKGDLNNIKQITSGTSRNDGLLGLAWIDEENIVYTSNDEKIRDWNLWTLDVNNGSKQKLTSDSEKQNDFPTVSTDKKTVYFSSDRKKESRIWRINLDGSNLTQVTFGEDETHHNPQISPEGKWLYFIIKSGRSSTIGRKSLVENSVQELFGKTKFVPGNFLSLSPDGKYLAFQNLSQSLNSPNNKLQLAIISTENPDNVSFQDVETWRQIAQWKEDNKSFDYISGNFKESGISRLSIENEAPANTIIQSNLGAIFNFAWSPSGENLAVSRGQLLRDVVLLTNFD